MVSRGSSGNGCWGEGCLAAEVVFIYINSPIVHPSAFEIADRTVASRHLQEEDRQRKRPLAPFDWMGLIGYLY